MKERILVINDDDSIREITKMVLEAKGYELSEAINGRLGLAQALAVKPDLILLDIMMPEMDGYETCEKLKASPATRDIPILFFSSLTNPKDKIRGLELGAVDFINNVVDHGELLARVQTHLEIQGLTRALKNSNEQLMQKQKALDDDLRAAAAIQQSFLPSTALRMNGVQMSSFWHPANPLGGDIFNLIQKEDGKIILYMIDVSGHDVPSALVTVSVSQYLHQNADSSSLLSPQQMMLALDEEYPLERFNRYFTIFYMVIDPSTGNFNYSCAGHPPAIILKNNGEIKLLDKGGTIIGLNKKLPFEEAEEQLEIGSKLFLYTDGIIERKNQNGNEFGTDRFYELLKNIQHEPLDRIVKMVYESLKNFSDYSQDDMSLLGFERM